MTPVQIMDHPPPGVLESLDELLFDEAGNLRVLEADVLDALDPKHLRFWCHVRAVYLIPSQELVTFIEVSYTKGRKAIEIAAGNGALGRALGIPMTDNRMQERPGIRTHLALMHQPPVCYGDDVVKRNANAAVRLSKPDVVVASWATHIYREDDHARGGNVWGIDEQKIVEAATYVHIGSVSVHSKKRIMALPHDEYELPGWIFGRGESKDRRLWVWKK